MAHSAADRASPSHAGFRTCPTETIASAVGLGSSGQQEHADLGFTGGAIRQIEDRAEASLAITSGQRRRDEPSTAGAAAKLNNHAAAFADRFAQRSRA
jgi:hypothetical protein